MMSLIPIFNTIQKEDVKKFFEPNKFGKRKCFENMINITLYKFLQILNLKIDNTYNILNKN